MPGGIFVCHDRGGVDGAAGRGTGIQRDALQCTGQYYPAPHVSGAEGEKRRRAEEGRETGEGAHFPALSPIRLRCAVGSYPE